MNSADHLLDDIEVIKAKLKVPSNIAIITHRNPDGDAIGSSFALKLFLEQFAHKCDVILPSEYPGVFSYVPQIESATIYDLNKTEAISILKHADVLFA